MSSSDTLLDTAKKLYMFVIWYETWVVFDCSAFYTDNEYIIADRLVRYQYIRDDEVESDNVIKLPHKYVDSGYCTSSV